VHTVRAIGTVTRVMARMKAGEIIGIRGPFGTPWPVQEAEGNDLVIIGGGIGLAPLRPALYYTLANRSRFGKVVLLYGTRTPQDILYRKELEALRARFDLDVDVTVDRAGSDWHGDVGVVTRLIPKASFDPASTFAFICGPEVMMRFTAMALQKREVPLQNIYLTMERNMKCAIGLCGHCQMGPLFVCKDGPVFRYDRIRDIFTTREI
ncbi:Ni/Fe hydrogenase subunit gamma, partial [candidate division GN15 bacterium]